MKPVLLYGLLAALFLCLGSCKNTDDEFLPDDVLPPVPEGYIRMQITVPGLTPVSTYALGTADETHVSEVDVLVFGSDSKYLCYAAVTEPAKITGTGSTKTFDVDLRAAGNITGAYVMVIANASVDTTGFAASQPTKETVMGYMTFTSSGKWNATGSSNFTPFPMWGMTASPVSLAGASSIPSISLLRSVARVDVGINFLEDVTDGTETGQGLTLSTTFTLEEVYLYNSLNKGSIAPHSGNYSGTTVSAPSIPDSPSAPGINDSPVPSYLSSNGAADGFSSDKFSCTGAIYMAEHAAGTNALTDNPYLVIGGKYNGSGTVTYYRLDFVSGNYPDQEFLPVLRNHRYRFNITGVAGPGYGSVTAAAEARPVNLTYDLSATDESLASYVYNGQYALGVSQDSYTFDRDGKSGNSLKISATFGKYNAVINPVAPTNNIDWLTGVTGAGDNVAAFGELTFNVAANNSGGERSAEIVITSGLLTKEVTVRQTNTVAFGLDVTPVSYTSGGSKTLTFESSYPWQVNVTSDPDAIVTSFDASETVGGTFRFTLKTASEEYLRSATFTFISPTGEFTPKSKTVSLLGIESPYTPSSTHKGWAGSNIYWDNASQKLTFADTPSDDPSGDGTGSERYQGVFFKWGSLVGLDPSCPTTDDTAWGGSSPYNNVYVYYPTWNETNPAASTWTRELAKNVTVAYNGQDNGSAVTAPNNTLAVWGNIPWVSAGNTTNSPGMAYLSTNAGSGVEVPSSTGGHIPRLNTALALHQMKGDICRYLTQTGDAPGSPQVKWRMPYANEFAVSSGAAESDSNYKKFGTDWNTVNPVGTSYTYGLYTPVSGRRKMSDRVPASTGYRPFFPTGGYRHPNGELSNVGVSSDWWSSSPYSNSNAYSMWFLIGSMEPVANRSRVYGFHVRCVKEL